MCVACTERERERERGGGREGRAQSVEAMLVDTKYFSLL